MSNSIFDADWYLNKYSDVKNAGIDAESHYDTYGWHEGRDANPFFDTSYYEATYTDVSDAKVNPLDHYETYGAAEGRDPSIYFDSSYYLAQNSDVKEAGMNPLYHFLVYGASEGRLPYSGFDEAAYRAANPDVDAAITAGTIPSAVFHFAVYGLAEGRSGAGSNGSTQNVSGRVVDGYVSGATVFADANGDGVWNEGEARATTDAKGNFTLEGGSGGIVAQGGTDISTGKAFKGVLKAPEGATVINPLTTMQKAFMDKGLSAQQAEEKVGKALGIDVSTVDLANFDMLGAALDPNASADAKALAADMQSEAAKIMNFLVAGAGTLQGAAGGEGNLSDQQAMDALMSSMVELIDNDEDGVISMADASFLGEVMTGSVEASGDEDLLAAADKINDMADEFSTMMADSAENIDEIIEGGGNVTEALVNIAKASSFAQHDMADKMEEAADGGSLDDLVDDFTGEAADQGWADAEIGDLDPDSDLDDEFIDDADDKDDTGGDTGGDGNDGDDYTFTAMEYDGVVTIKGDAPENVVVNLTKDVVTHDGSQVHFEGNLDFTDVDANDYTGGDVTMVGTVEEIAAADDDLDGVDFLEVVDEKANIFTGEAGSRDFASGVEALIETLNGLKITDAITTEEYKLLDELSTFDTADLTYTEADETAPKMTSAIVAADGLSIAITYDEELTAGTFTADATDFSVTLAGGTITVTDLVVTGSTVTLTVDTAIPAGNTVVTSIAYDASANTSNTIKDDETTPNAAADQTLSSGITNNSTVTDSTAPEKHGTTPIALNDADSSSTYSAGDQITLMFTEAIDGSSLGIEDLVLSNHGFGTGATLTPVSPSNGYTTTFTVTLGTDTNVVKDDTITIAAEKVHDLAGNNASGDQVFTLPESDTTAPAKPVITSIADDSGATGDGITNDQTLSVIGTAEANSSVQLFVGGVATEAKVITDNSGHYTIDYTSASFNGGAYEFTVKATDAASNVSDASDTFNVTVDITPPTVSAVPTVASSTTISVTSNEDGTAGVYTSTPALVDGTKAALTADQPGSITVAAQDSLTTGNVTVADAAGNTTAGTTVHLGTSGDDSFTATGTADIMFGFNGADSYTLAAGAQLNTGLAQIGDYAVNTADESIIFGGTAAAWLTDNTVSGWAISSGVATKENATVQDFYTAFITAEGAAGAVIAFENGGNTYLFGEGATNADNDNTAVVLVGVTGIAAVDTSAAEATVLIA